MMKLLEEDEIEDSADGGTKDDCQNDGNGEADAVGVIFWSGDDSGFAAAWRRSESTRLNSSHPTTSRMPSSA